jgi:hypothetical protein
LSEFYVTIKLLGKARAPSNIAVVQRAAYRLHCVLFFILGNIIGQKINSDSVIFCSTSGIPGVLNRNENGIPFLLYLHANKVRKNPVFVSPVYPRNTSGQNRGIPIGQKKNIAVFFKNTFFIPLATRANCWPSEFITIV